MSVANSNETRPGVSLPKQEREALARIMGWVGVGTANVEGASNGLVVARYYEGWLDSHLWQAVHIPDQPTEDGYRRLVHGWSGETLAQDPVAPGRPYASKVFYHLYEDGDMRVAGITPQAREEGIRPVDLSAVYDNLREFSYRPAPYRPVNASEAAMRVAQNLPDDVLRAAAVWMLEEAAAVQPRTLAA